MNTPINERHEVEEIIVFDMGLEVRKQNGKIGNWEQLKQQIECECKEYENICDCNGGC
jgi:hypothetical protein